MGGQCRHLGGGVFEQEGLNVIEIEPVVTAFAYPVGFNGPGLAPESNRVRMDVEQVGHFIDGQHWPGGDSIFTVVF